MPVSAQSTSAPADTRPSATLYAEIQQFYAEHMRLLDEGAGEEWAAMFTEDGSFKAPSTAEPVRGRSALVAGAASSAAALADAGETRRHVLNMTTVTPLEDGALRVQSYAQIIATRLGEQPRLHLMCVCTDTLVREDGELRVRERHVTRDGDPT